MVASNTTRARITVFMFPRQKRTNICVKQEEQKCENIRHAIKPQSQCKDCSPERTRSAEVLCCHCLHIHLNTLCCIIPKGSKTLETVRASVPAWRRKDRLLRENTHSIMKPLWKHFDPEFNLLFAFPHQVFLLLCSKTTYICYKFVVCLFSEKVLSC